MKCDVFDIYSDIYLSTREYMTILKYPAAVIFLWSAVPFWLAVRWNSHKSMSFSLGRVKFYFHNISILKFYVI